MQTRPQEVRPIQSGTIVIGVDVGKDQFEALAVAADQRQGGRHRFRCDAKGFQSVLEYAESSASALGSGAFVFAMEPTGHYGEPLAGWLQSRGAEVRAVSPLKTARAKELYDGTVRKTDQKDALVIASLTHAGLDGPWRRPTGPFGALRALGRRWEQLTKQRTRETNRLHGVMDLLFPELRTLFGSVTSKSCLWLLATAPTPSAVLGMTEEALVEGLKQASRGQLGLERARELRQAAERTVGLLEGTATLRFLLAQHLEQLVFVVDQMKRVEAQMKEALAEVPYRDRLLSVPGVGLLTAATLLGEFGDLRGFRHSRQLLKLAGLDLIENSSGARMGSRRVSKRGRPYLRQVLYMAALRGAGSMARRRDRLVGRGVQRKKAAVANMCALIRILHALVRDDVDFDVNREAATT